MAIEIIVTFCAKQSFESTRALFSTGSRFWCFVEVGAQLGFVEHRSRSGIYEMFAHDPNPMSACVHTLMPRCSDALCTPSVTGRLHVQVPREVPSHRRPSPPPPRRPAPTSLATFSGQRGCLSRMAAMLRRRWRRRGGCRGC
jgi:hypothetical protein